MQLDTQTSGEHLVVRPMVERLDTEVALEFLDQMARLVLDGHTKIVLNLDGVDFIDSSGLGAVVSILKLMKPSQGELSVCNVSETVMSMFRLTRMDKVFAMYANVKDALVGIST